MSSGNVIAIVDDDPSVREGVSDLLNSMGFATETFRSAEEFLGAKRVEDPVCLITDGRMSGMSGFALHQQLLSSGRRVPTILITAFPNKEDQARAVRAGIACYLPKPFEESALLACLRSAMASVREGRAS